MRVLFNHLRKCGGTSIRKIAEEQYKNDFHYLDNSTSEEELNQWLKKERCFISAELWDVDNKAIIFKLLTDKSINRIILSRNPINSFKSLCGHSTRVKGDVEGIAFWGNDQFITEAFDANEWLKVSLRRMEDLLSKEQKSLLTLGRYEIAFPGSIYNQWWLGSFKSFIHPDKQIAEYLGYDFKEHIQRNRSYRKCDIIDLMMNVASSLYIGFGTTEKFDQFLFLLVELGIFNSIPIEIPNQNSSQEIQREKSSLFKIDRSLIGEYYALLPEDFYFHNVIKELADKQITNLTSKV